MLETPSAMAAESVTPFASPMLASVERFLSRLSGRVAGPQSQLSGRLQQFADRILSRRLDVLGMGLRGPASAFAERETEPQSWPLAEGWIPGSADLRGGTRRQPPVTAAARAPIPRSLPQLAPASPATAPQSLDLATSAVRPAAPSPSPLTAERRTAEAPMPQVAPSWLSPPARQAPTAGPRLTSEAPPAGPRLTSEAPPAGPRLTGETPSAVPHPTGEAALPAEPAAQPVAAARDGAPIEPQRFAASPEQPALVAPSTGADPSAAAVAAPSVVSAAPATMPRPAAAATQPASAATPAGSPSTVSPPAVALSGPPLAPAAALRAPALPGAVVAAPAVMGSTPPDAPTAVAGGAPPVLGGQRATAAAESRVRDLLPTAPDRTPPRVASGLTFSALARSFAHLGWSDDRLGRPAGERGVASGPALTVEDVVAPATSQRAAAAPALPMVRPAEAPRAPAASRLARPSGQPVGAASLPPVVQSRLPAGELPQVAMPSVPLAEPLATSETAQQVEQRATTEAAPVVSARSAAAVSADVATPAAAAAQPTVAREASTPASLAEVTPSLTASPEPDQAAVEPPAVQASAAAPDLPRSDEARPVFPAAAAPPARRAGPAAAAEPRAQSFAYPAAPLARTNLAAGPSLAPMSPSLFASPALQTQGGSGASLARLLLAGQAGGALPPSATTPLQRTPGSLAMSTEQLALSIGTHAAGGAAGINNPFGGAHLWSRAPGVSGVVARALAESEPALPARWAQLMTGSPLPYLPAPTVERRALSRAAQAPTAPATWAAAAAPSQRVSPSMEVGAAPPSAVDLPLLERSSSATAAAAEPSAPPSERQMAAPWQLAGGVATLAELFAAGVGLGTGAASQIAHQVGVSPAAGLLPPWLRSAAPAAGRVLSAPAISVEREGLPGTLEFVARDQRPATARTEQPALRSVLAPSASPLSSRWQPPLAAASAAVAAQPATVSAQPAARTDVAAGMPMAQPLPSYWQHAGGLASTAEAFARGHGIERAEQGAASPSVAAQGGRWVAVTGGMVFVSPETRRSASADSAIPGQRVRGLTPPAVGLAPALQTTAERNMDEVATVQAAETAVAPRQTERVAPAAAPQQSVVPREAAAAEASTSTYAPALDRSIDWRRAGGVGLRTELFAAGLGTAGLAARPLSTPRELPSWSTAPGVSAPLARALGQSEPAAPARWTFSSNGLLFLSAPSAVDAPARSAPPVRAASGQSSSVAAALPLLSAPSVLEAMGAPAAEPSGVASPAGLSDRPWQHAGGTAILAELFAAGVGLGAGAASGLAQQVGVAGGRSMMPAWLARLLPPSAAESATSSERPAGAELALPLVPRDERRPASAVPAARRLTPGQTPAAAPLTAGLPLPAAEPGRPSLDGEVAMAAEARPLPWTAATPPSVWQRAGGLAASAEAFARGHGLEPATAESGLQAEDAEPPVGRWLSISGGLVFVPQDRPVAAPDRRALRATRTVLPPSEPAADQALPLAAAASSGAAASGVGGWQQAGGLGLRSELFAAGLGSSSGALARSSGDTLGGWADSHRMLTSFLQPPDTEAAPPARFGWSGPGGLLYLASPSLAGQSGPRTARAERPTAARLGASAAAAEQLASGPASLFERLGAGPSAEAARASEDNPMLRSSVMPLTSLLDGPEAPQAAAAASGAALPGRLGTAMLTSFPRAAAGGSAAPQSLWPASTMHSVERLAGLLAQLPTQWRPSPTMLAAMQATDAPASPLWRQLPTALPKVTAGVRGPAASRDEDDADEGGFGERQPQLTLVSGGQPSASARAQRSAEPAWKQQTPEAMVSAALQKVAGSGAPMAAAAKMLEAIRSHATGQPTKSDDRVSLGDLTLIALSMGQNKMAAISATSRQPVSAPPLEDANRQREVPNGPETEDSLHRKVRALAERVLKEVEKHETNQRERGYFDA